MHASACAQDRGRGDGPQDGIAHAGHGRGSGALPKAGSQPCLTLWA
jgi:hypothetical protein